jgi:hypothetical protein
MGLEDREEVRQVGTSQFTGSQADSDTKPSKNGEKSSEKLKEELDSDDDEVADVEVMKGQTIEGHRSRSGDGDLGGDGGQANSVEDKMKMLMEMIDKRDKLIAQLKEGKPILPSEETKCLQVDTDPTRRKESSPGETVAVREKIYEKFKSEAKFGGDIRNFGEDLRVSEIGGEIEKPVIKIQTSFASRVLENIKMASVQKVNIENDPAEVDDKGQGRGVDAEDQGHGVDAEGQGHGVDAEGRGHGIDAKVQGRVVYAKGQVHAKGQGRGPVHYSSKEKMGPRNSFDVVKNSLFAWKTSQTVEYLATGNDADFMNKILLQKKVERICKNLDEEEALESLDKEGMVDDSKSKQTLPDYQELAKQTQECDVKVKEFFGGHLTYTVEDEKVMKTEMAESGAQVIC